MIDLKSIFKHGAKDFFSANAALSLPSKPNKTRSKGIGGGWEGYVDEVMIKQRRDKMNKTEAEFAMILEAQKRAGEILRYEFEGITLRFANVKYTPDFVVIDYEDNEIPMHQRRQGGLRFIEVKGPFIKGNRERAVERFRHAKTYWPEFTFEMHQRTKDGQWKQLI